MNVLKRISVANITDNSVDEEDPEEPGEESPEFPLQTDLFVETPKIVNLRNGTSKIFQSDETHKSLLCQATGKPEPNVQWKYNESAFPNLLSVPVASFGALLFLPTMNESLDGHFTCEASNDFGKSTVVVHLTTEESNDHEPPGFTFGLMSGIALTILLVGLIYGILTYRRALEKKKKIEIMAGLSKEEIEEFQNGDPDGLIFNAFAHENAKFQPYNKDYEIPDDQLRIDTNKLLGSGAFGLVYQGMKDSQTVAVKTLKPNPDKMYIKALLTELKVMIYIGKHENIVSLIGAKTTELDRGYLHIVVEYCGLGSLESYIKKNYTNFVNWSGDDSYANAPTDIRGTCEFTDQDLIRWSYQIAAGLMYLGSKKVIHGDLACRNVLLKNKSLVKITDFGLSRQLYDYTNYVKKQQAPLPWRWMAVESLRSLTFSPQSDVWAFGITLWELFTLGDTPYPGLSWTLDFVDHLEQGLRLLKPKYCTDEMYEQMIYCWHVSPQHRPDISELHAWLEKLL